MFRNLRAALRTLTHPDQSADTSGARSADPSTPDEQPPEHGDGQSLGRKRSLIAQALGWNDRVSAAVLSLCLADLVLLGLTLWAIFDYRATTDDRGNARNLLLALDATLISLVDAETNQRAYLITNDARFLEPYRAAAAAVDGDLLAVSNLLVGHGAVEQQRYGALVPVVAAKKQELAQTLALRNDGQTGGIVAAVAGGTGVPLMTDIRAKIDVLRGDAEAASVNAEQRSNTLGTVLATSAIGLGVLTFGTVGTLTFGLRRRVEAEALRNAGAAKDEFVGFVSHELRGPIELIAGNARLLADYTARLDAVAHESLEEISRGAERLEATVTTLLNLARAEAGGTIDVEPVLIQRLAEGAVRYHNSRFPSRQVRVEHPPVVPPVSGNRAAVEQVLLNLLQNAEKYGDPVAPILVALEPAHTMVTVRVVSQGGQLDRGQFRRVFEPYFRLSNTAATADGVGLGLTVCRRLIDAQGGSMAAEALPTGGASFSFQLPIAATLEAGED